MKSELISIAKQDTLASLCGLNIYLQKTLYFLVSQRNIELKTSKHEFTDISDQNKQGFEGKKLSGMEYAHNWLKLLTSCWPNLEVSGSNAIFCDFFFVVDVTTSMALGAGDNELS